MTICYNLHKLENALTFQVTEQGKSITEYLRAIKRFVSSNGWKIKTRNYPGLCMETSTIYVRGYNSALHTAPAYIFGVSNSDRDIIVSEIYDAIQELVVSAIGITDSKVTYPKYKSPKSNGHVSHYSV